MNKQIAEIFGISRNVADLLLGKISFKNSNDAATKNLYSCFSDGNLFAKGDNGAYSTLIIFTNFKDIYRSLILIHKSCTLINKFKISEEDLQWLAINQDRLDYLPWKTTQTISGDTTGIIYKVSNLLKFKKLLDVKNKYGGTINNISIFDISANNSTVYDATQLFVITSLSKITGWNLVDLKEICTKLLIAYKDSGIRTTLNLPETYEKIENCFNVINLAGIDAATVIKWANRTETEEEAVAERITSVLKSKYSYDQWLAELPPMQKAIREKKCHALSAYLIEDSQRLGSTRPEKWYDTNDLYGYFLIDTEMSACQFTSRIKMAMSSVQLFVQRCLLNLEPDVKTNKDSAWKQWKWMKNYRIWEANRKVFLYPENWIEPELRDDKTPFFVDLENELNQNDITADYAEEVFSNYLQKLHEVADIEVNGIYHEVDAADRVNTMHVIGRTRTNPHLYYYRKYDGNTNVWSAWEKMDLDIKGELVLPVVYNRKLHIFWLVANEKAKKDTRAEEPNKANPIEYMEVQIAWSVLKKKGWTPAKQSKRKHFEWGHLPSSSFSLVSTYNSKNNELNFFLTVNNGSIGKNTKKQDIGTIYYNHLFTGMHETAQFLFNGDVHLVKTSFIDFTTEHDGKWGYYSFNESEFKYSDAHPENKEHPFKIVTKGLDNSLIPEKNNNIRPYWFYAMSILANRIHFIEKNSANENLVCLFYWPYPKPMLHTKNTDPNFVMDLQKDSDNIFNNVYESHKSHPFFYQDSRRAFFVKPNRQSSGITYNFSPFYHPFTNLFNRELNRSGIEGLLNRDIQVNPQNKLPRNSWFNFNTEYSPQTWSSDENGTPQTNSALLDTKYLDNNHNKNIGNTPLNEFVDFSFGSAYAVYNWELFFHAPLYIACKLSQNQKFEEAMQWFHYIFNPTNATNISDEVNGNNVPQKFWITKPFFEISDNEIKADNIGNILRNIDIYKDQVTAWLNDPFKPHLIARYRPVAYQRTVVMKYIDNLIAWGDQLFKRDTIESINEATMLYVLAYEILGPKPVKHPLLTLDEKTYLDIRDDYDDFISFFDKTFKYDYKQSVEKLQAGNRNMLAQKSMVNSARETTYSNISPEKSNTSTYSINEPAVSTALKQNSTHFRETNLPVYTSEEQMLPRIDAKNFCIPANDILLGYWDLVEDRLYKIRHCMNIKGIVRQLPLFEPPIDPALLVRAAAAGLDFGSVLDDMAVPHPNYRFRVMLQKAVEFCSEVKQLGEKLLATIEKKDAEGLTILRSVQEINVLNAVKQVRKLQIQEATESVASLEKTMLLTEERKNYYQNLIDNNLNSLETASLNLNNASAIIEYSIAGGYTLASMLAIIPDLHLGGAGTFGSPFLSTVPSGGTKLGTSVQNAMTVLSTIARALDKNASLLTTKAQYQRRREEWDFQAKMAEMEMEQINKQILAAEIRQQISEKELENQDLQIEQAKTSDEYYKSKFSNEQLYNWMLSQISNIYFQSYQLAYEMAKKAEKCYRYELGINDSSQFINFGYWDSLKKGLLAGDLLMNDLHRLDAAYIDQNSREYELSKHISLAQMFPDKLIDIVTKGESFINLPEWLFNMDYTGHYMRRIKSVSINIPNVAGPYTNVNCTLSLLKSEMRINSLLKDGSYTKITESEDNRFIEKMGVTQSIATSHGQNDAGLFELNFNDERYLPFEGAGAISEWKISLPKDSNQFDFASISDLIIHINYTAREGGDMLGTAAKAALISILENNGLMLFSLKHDFPTEWNSFIQNTNHILEFNIKDEHLPYYAKFNNVKTLNSFIVIPSLKKPLDNWANKLKYQRPVDTSLSGTGLTPSSNIYPTVACTGLSVGIWKLQLITNTTPISPAELAKLDDLFIIIQIKK